MESHYLNTDLGVVGTGDPAALVAALEAHGAVLIETLRTGGTWHATFEAASGDEDPDATIHGLLDAVDDLEGAARGVWDAAQERELNIRYDCDDLPWAFNQALPPETLARVAEASVTLRWTLYPAEPGARDSLARISDPAVDDTVRAASSSDDTVPAKAGAGAARDEPIRGVGIGRFVVLGVLGQGGMGVVYSGYDPSLDRKVAIKLLRATAARSESIDARARLLREAQAMAKINHPNVIKVHEVGTFRDQVYLAMEFADGGTLRSWLRAQVRSSREILAVFALAGRGLAAAHAAGLVHRDFKPDNVLMGKDGSVRVTDFGLVTTEDAPPTEPARPAPEVPASRTTPLSQDLTRTGAIMGTPPYMAPEQLNGDATSPRTDQFAFCVALYEALYGERPFPGSSYQELMTRVLLGTVSPAPRTARVPGWLRRVLLRGLAIAPADRFESMTELLSALAREPVRRRRRGFAAASLVACLGLVGVFVYRSNPSDVCGGGEARVAAIWSPARKAAMKAAFDASARPLAALTFPKVIAVLDDWGHGWELGYVEACKDTRVRGAQSEHLLDLRMQCLSRRLDEAHATIDLLVAGGGDAIDHAVDAVISLPAVDPCSDRAALLAVIPPPDTPMAAAKVAAVHARIDEARGQRRLGRYDKALALATPALAWAGDIGYLPAKAEALFLIGWLQHDLGDPASATTVDQAMNAYAEADDTTNMIEAASFVVASLSLDTARLDRAQEVATFAETTARRVHPSIEASVHLEHSIGFLLAAKGKPAEARVRLEHALAVATEKLGPDDPNTVSVASDLGNLAQAEGRFADARKILESGLASAERVFGKDHPNVAAALNNLGRVDVAEGKYDAAKQRFERALEIRIATLGPDHPEVGESLNSLGTFYNEQGDTLAARRYFERALGVYEKAKGADSLEAAMVLSNLGTAQLGHDNAAARARLERGLAIYERAYGKDNPRVASTLQNLSIAAQNQHKLDEAAGLLQRALQITEKAYGPEHPDVADGLVNLADVLRLQHKLAEAETTASRAVATMEKAYGADHAHMAMALAALGKVQSTRHEYPAALASFQRSIAIFEAKLGKDNPDISDPLGGLGGALVEQGRASEAVPLLERALALRTANKLPPGDVGEVRFLLAKALAGDPRQHARARTEATTALAEVRQADNQDDAAELVKWLDEHR